MILLEQINVCSQDAHVCAIADEVGEHFVGYCCRLAHVIIPLAQVLLQLSLQNRHGRLVAFVPLQQLFDLAVGAFLL